MNDATPVMKQYQEAKKAAGNALLLFRMGDFYELFFEDAYKAADALGIAVTSRDRNKGADATPMAGFPYVQLENYLAKLLVAGFKVAVCEQVEDPKKAKGLVRREVVRIVTPGTVVDESILDPRRSNFLAAIAYYPSKNDRSSSPLARIKANTQTKLDDTDPSILSPRELLGLSWCDLSTGKFFAAVLSYAELFDQISRIGPAEVLVTDELRERLPAWFAEQYLLTSRPDWTFTTSTAQEQLTNHFQVQTLEGFGFTGVNEQYALCAAGSILYYLQETQKQSLAHIETLTPYRSGRQMELDEATCRSLELLQSGYDRHREGSLLGILDHCATSMGSRLLGEWVCYPLTEREPLELRQEAIGELLDRGEETERIHLQLQHVSDLERILSKVIQDRAIPRDLLGIERTLRILPEIKTFLASSSFALLKKLYSELEPLEALDEELRYALNPEAPLNWREGGFINTGYSSELDELRLLQRGGKDWLVRYQASESERTGIPNLRIGYTSVFGYFIEVSRSQLDKIPDNYHRKQTLKNAERFITEELRLHEAKVLEAEDSARELELTLFSQLIRKVVDVRSSLQQNASVIAQLDVLSELALLARKWNYRRPELIEEPTLEILDGRHPVLEQMEQTGTFVPNSAWCDTEHGQLHLITGPNMAGKSTFIRQIALLVIMAQIGSFIPVTSAKIGLVDRIFARVGASDELTRGRSTFMVEMIEAARILNGATSRSLVILDEIGRGTSTYDGISLAWSIAEFLHNKVGCRTFFATHYHELTELAETYEGVNNLNVAVREKNDEIIFLHQIVQGAADRSYGIHVARLAGVPRDVIRRSREILSELEHSHLEMAGMALRNALHQSACQDAERQEATQSKESGALCQKKKIKQRSANGTIQFSLFGAEDHPVIEALRSLQIEELTPMQALQWLEHWQKEL